ncbi:DUF4062 domain-containing protein [Spirosoma validum]|uniref:DUF4062 domain-containing protein n=1 Tax=Spirosoma validum TaxID=2771355 RepID=A0A927GGS1_9BACT|nr:DUF4062 domain-containing protein [Spirosoma validum]MBD2757179.1 DUF4062 domain-containing protein [Spirosoma validum]
MAIPYRVFLSSTFKDLADHRTTVQAAIRQLGITDVSMENFGARNEYPAQECIDIIKNKSEIFVGIYAFRYGFCPDGSAKSILEMEYEAASEANLPRFIYIIDDNQPWPPLHTDQGENAQKLRAFKDILLKRHICAWFTNQDQLATKVVADLGRYIATKDITYIDPYNLPSAGTSLAPDNVGDWGQKPSRLRGWFYSFSKYSRKKLREYAKAYLQTSVGQDPQKWNQLLDSTMEEKRKIFLTHSLQPSSVLGQRFDVFIYLIKHQSEDLSEVLFAEFFMGPYWQNHIFKSTAHNGFIGIKTAAYGTFLCICRVTFRDGSIIYLNRYIDFQ